MAWWNKVWSAAKSAVNKAWGAVKNVARGVSDFVSNSINRASDFISDGWNTVKKKAKKKAKKVKDTVKKVADTVKKTVSTVVNKVKDTVKKVADTVSDIVSNSVSKAGEAVKKVKDIISDAVSGALDKAGEVIKKLGWKESLTETIRSTAKKILPLLFMPQVDAVINTYTFVTGKEVTAKESLTIKAKILDFILPLNSLSKLIFGKNLDGEPEEFGSFGDYADIVLSLAIIVPAGQVGKVASKLGIKAGTKLGTKGFIKFATTKIDDAAKLFRILNVDDQVKLVGKLLKTDDGVKIINRLLSKKALHATLVKPSIKLVNEAIAKKILVGKGLSRFLPAIAKPKTIAWSIGGMLGAVGSAYGISFGTTWFAKEGLIEQLTFPLSDLMRDYRFDPTPEKAERIGRLIDKLRETIPRAQKLIRGVSWLWPFTRSYWLEYADNLEFLLDQVEEEFVEIEVPPIEKVSETFKKEEKRIEGLPVTEIFRAVVRDIIDGDTIDVALSSSDEETGQLFDLPEYRETTHARVRIVGINAPEKSPKGEILCTAIEIYKVEKKFADESRDRLLPLNDKWVTLKVDPDNPVDSYNRVLAVVEHGGEDIGLRQIKEGLACYYFRDFHKYVDSGLYSEETRKAKRAGKGMWAGLEEIEKEEDKIKIKITSEPTYAKLFLDDIALHHNTPSDEEELSDVIQLFTEGPHVLSAEKGGLSAMIDIEITKGDQGEFHLVLETEPLPEVPTPEEIEEEELEEEIVEEEVEEEEIEEEIIPEVEEPEELAKIPAVYTTGQEWALREAFTKILFLTEGRAIMSAKERDALIADFTMHSDEQKQVLKLLWKDLTFYTQGRKQLSADEYIALSEKYRMI